MTDPNTAGVRVEESFWPQDPALERAVMGGVTTIAVLPGSANLIGGRGVVLHMERWNAGSPGFTREGFYPEAQDTIEELARRWRVPLVLMDAAKAGKPIFQALARKKIERIRFEGLSTEATGRRTRGP